MCRSRSGVGLFVLSCVDLITLFVLCVRIDLGGVDHSETRLGFHFEVKVRSFSSLDLLFCWFSALKLVFFGGDSRG